MRRLGGDGGESNSPSRTLRRRPLRACPMVCRRPPGRTSAPCRTVQSRVPRSGLTPDYATLIRIAASLSDASTTREAEVASTLTLLPKQRGRESTGGCQVLRFAACLTRPDGTSARTLRQPSPVETTHPHRTERRFGLIMLPRDAATANGATDDVVDMDERRQMADIGQWARHSPLVPVRARWSHGSGSCGRGP